MFQHLQTFGDLDFFGSVAKTTSGRNTVVITGEQRECFGLRAEEFGSITANRDFQQSNLTVWTVWTVWTVLTVWTVWTTSERKIVGIRAGLLQLGLRLPRSQEKKMAKIGLMLAKQCEIRVCLIHNIHSDSDSKDALRVHTYQSIYNCVLYVFCHLLTHFHFIKHPCVV